MFQDSVHVSLKISGTVWDVEAQSIELIMSRRDREPLKVFVLLRYAHFPKSTIAVQERDIFWSIHSGVSFLREGEEVGIEPRDGVQSTEIHVKPVLGVFRLGPFIGAKIPGVDDSESLCRILHLSSIFCTGSSISCLSA